MTRRVAWHAIVAASTAWVLFAGTQSSARGASPDEKWMANGATACEKYLTPDVMAAITSAKPAPTVKDDADSSHNGSVYIRLKVADVATFKLEVPRIAMTHPMTGVGDAAYWNHAGAVSAVKAPDRGCDIGAPGAPNTTKIKDEVLGQKLGDICNKLFALR